MKQLISLLAITFLLFTCGSDDDTKEPDRTLEYENYLTGIWIPVKNGEPVSSTSVIRIYNNDRTGLTRNYQSYKDGVYTILSDIELRDVRVENIDGKYQLSCKYDGFYQGQVVDITDELLITYMDRDSLVLYTSVYRKVPSINIAE